MLPFALMVLKKVTNKTAGDLAQTKAVASNTWTTVW